ncbi:MAG: isoprenylcysteine carboxylmethyltransferase family protein [Acidobacteria bacterium]|nr:isoprenylcysteine carboxylmethyltransferase family protein [Acidobacteriota bacterium]
MSEFAGNSGGQSDSSGRTIRPTFFARWRVRVGYLLAIVVLLLARPTPQSIAIGGAVGLVGLLVRALAAGHLHKQEMLTVSGPYAHTRNPLYFGSAILTVGAAVAMNSWISAVLLLAYFAVFYSVVMRKEEGELRFHHGAAFEEYAKAVPLFFPRMTAAKLGLGVERAFSVAQYKKNREYRAAIGFLLLLVALVIDWRLRLIY